MNTEALKENLKKLKMPCPKRELYVQYPFDPLKLDNGSYITKVNDVWEFFYCDRGCKYDIGLFESEDDVLEYYYCCCKKASDEKRWW